MEKMKNIMAMMLVMMMVTISPLAVLAESEVPVEAVTEVNEAEETTAEEETPIEDKQVEEVDPVEEKQTEEVTPVEDKQVEEETPVEDKQVEEMAFVENEQVEEKTTMEDGQIEEDTEKKNAVTIVKTEDATVTASYAMFKVAEAAKVNTCSDGSQTVEITYTGSSFLKMYLGKAANAEATTEGIYEAVQIGEKEYKYEIPLKALDTAFDAAVLSSKGSWKDNTLTVSLVKETEPEEPKIPETVVIPADGKYTIDVTSSAAMFKVTECVLTVKDQKMTAVITLSGTGYDKLFVGSSEEASKATEDVMISYVEDNEGKYTYSIPVESLDKEIAIAAHSIKNNKWYDRALTFESSTLKIVSGDNSGNTKPEVNKPETNKPESGVTGDEEIKDMINNTTKGEVKNGTYKPSFGYKGGTGRTTLSCNKVVVLKGKATATVVFSSPNYTYMKVNGTKYYNVNKGGNSTFVIPVKLNGATTVYAETTAMSEAHEIQYVLYVYVNGKNVSYIRPAAHVDEQEKEMSEEETAEVTEEAAEEENGWGAFNSEQTAETTGAVEESEDTGSAAASSSSAIPVIPIVIAAAVIGGAGVVLATKKKFR